MLCSINATVIGSKNAPDNDADDEAVADKEEEKAEQAEENANEADA